MDSRWCCDDHFERWRREDEEGKTLKLRVRLNFIEFMIEFTTLLIKAQDKSMKSLSCSLSIRSSIYPKIKIEVFALKVF